MPITKSRARSTAKPVRQTTAFPADVRSWNAAFDLDAEGGKARAVFSLYGAAPMVRIELARHGVPAETVSVIARAMGVARDTLYKTLGVKRATVERKIREKERLSQDQTERVMGVVRLIGQVDEMVRSSGNPKDFDAAQWVAKWLSRPLAALGGRAPGTLLDTAEGRDIVSGLVAQIQSGAYA